MVVEDDVCFEQEDALYRSDWVVDVNQIITWLTINQATVCC